MNKDISFQDSLFINYAKAIGIIVVVMGHFSWNSLNIFKPYIYHMPLFFIIGGLLIKPISSKKKLLKNIVEKYVIYVLVWYIAIGIFAYLSNKHLGTKIHLNVFPPQDSNYFLQALKTNMHGNNLFQVAWFLVAYLITSVLFRIQISLASTAGLVGKNFKIFILFIGLLAGFISIEHLSPLYQSEKIWWYNLICQVGVGYMFIAIGYFIRDHLNIFSSIPFLVFCILVMYTFSGNGTFHPLIMSWSKYPDGFLVHLASSLVGCAVILSVSYIFSRAITSKALETVGTLSKDIMSLHLMSFVLIDFAFCYLGYFDFNRITASVHYSTPSVFAIYVGGGVVLPILIHQIILSLKKGTVAASFWLKSRGSLASQT